MHFYAVELFFDAPITDKVRELWKELAEAGLTDRMYKMEGARPHITLTAFSAGELTDEEVIERFQQLTLPERSLDLTFEGLSTFFPQTGVVYLPPAPSEELLVAHREFFASFYKYDDLTAFEHYLPKRWVPHCTLAIRLPLEQIHEVLGFCLPRLTESLRAKVVSVGLVKIERKEGAESTTSTTIAEKQLG